MKFIKKYYLVIFIVLIGAFFRLYRLDSVPPSPSLDEVTYGYNAYSILKTGKDEYGNFMPILLRAYDDWRPALYVYFVAPLVKILGLGVLSVRLPSAILSTVTIIFVYLLAKELFDSKKYSFKIGDLCFDISHVAAMLFAISPWNIYISRLGHEVNLGFSFFIFAVYFFFTSIRHRHRNYWLVLSASFFALTFYTYQSFKIITTLFLAFLSVFYLRDVLRHKLSVLLSLVVFFIITVPILQASLAPEALIRFNGASAFAGNTLYSETDAKWLAARIKGDKWDAFLNDPKMTATRIVVSNYLTHFNWTWLTQGGITEKFKIPGLGLIYIWEAPLIMLGLIYLLKSDFDKKLKFLILFWIFSAPIPASVTTQAPHAMRTMSVLPSLQFLSALGLLWPIIIFGKFKKTILIFWIILVLVSISYLYHQYFIVFPLDDSKSFQYALNRAMPYVISVSPKYQTVIVSNERNLSQSYMFYLYSSKLDPATYLAMGGTKSGGFAEFHVIGKFNFRPIHWRDERPTKGTLYLGNVKDFPKGSPFLKIFKSLDGTPAVQVIGY